MKYFAAKSNTDSRAKRRSSGSACPYAVAIVSDDDASTNSHSTADTHHVTDLNVLEIAKEKCPAFQTKMPTPKGDTITTTCPFKDAKTSSDIQRTLLRVPTSHSTSNHDFYKALKHLHNVSQKLNIPQDFALPGGCPMQSYHNSSNSSSSDNSNNSSSAVPFVKAMEDWSLASIMARMASDLENDEESNNKNDGIPDEKISTHTATTSSNSHVALLSEALKHGTAESHKQAESVEFVKNFIKGDIDRNLYKDLVKSLYYVYDALEEELDIHASKYFVKCHYPAELNRTDALKNDLDYWFGPSEAKSIIANSSSSTLMSEATKDYVKRVHYIGKTNPLLLLSHAYTRYLGDLSGGKILARVARKALGLSKDDDGLEFYEFSDIKSYKVFKDMYRLSLNELNLSADQISELVNEANIAFILNMRIFEELDVKANVPDASVRDLNDALAEFTSTSSLKKSNSNSNLSAMTKNIENSEEAKCPFLMKQKDRNKITVSTTQHVEEKHSIDSNMMMASENTTNKDGRCPWPFVFFHDPATGMRDYQTWIVIGLFLAYLWSNVMQA